MKLFKTLAVSAAVALASTSGVATAGTLEDVKARGNLNCIVTTGVAGFAAPNDQGRWEGFDVDFCRATAAAVLGDPNKVKFIPTTGKTRFTALNAGEGDILYRNTTITMSRDADLKLTFLGVNYYDGQGFMVRSDLGVKSAKELAGASVCVNIGTTTELNMADFFRANGMDYKPVVFEKADEVVAAYDAGRCDVYTTDASGLAAQRIKLKDPNAHVILPEIISKEPLGPVVRHGDNNWGDVVRWTLFAMVEAEELGVTSANVDEMKSSSNPNIKRLLGAEGEMGKSLGLPNEWAYNVIKQVGNYGESYDRNVGPNTALKLERGLNALWKDGGLQYPMPVR